MIISVQYSIKECTKVCSGVSLASFLGVGGRQA